MNLIGLGMNLLLAGLLVAAMVVGMRLNRRLQALRDSHAGFESAVRDLNLAAARAEQGLADLRAATDEATDMLSDRIEKGRELAARLDRAMASTPPTGRAPEPERAAPRPLPPVMRQLREEPSEERLGALLALARRRIQSEEPAPLAAARAPSPIRRPALSVDEDLFDDEPLTLERRAGAAR